MRFLAVVPLSSFLFSSLSIVHPSFIAPVSSLVTSPPLLKNFASRSHTNFSRLYTTPKNDEDETTTTTTTTTRNTNNNNNNNNNSAMEVPPLPPIPPMSKRLFLVRHGEVINPGGNKPVFYGALDVPLSPLGELEAKAAASYLQRFNLYKIAASPLSRAIFGATQVLNLQSKEGEKKKEKEEEEEDEKEKIVIYNGFRELDRGAWCGKTKEEIGSELMEKFDACDESVTPDGGESYPYLKERVLRAREELLEITPCGEASAVVSHLQVTRAMLSDALNIPTNKMVNLQIATASVTCIDYCQVTGEQTVHFQSFKPDVGLEKSKDGAN